MNAPLKDALWSMNASYNVDPAALPVDLLNDAVAMLAAAIATTELVACELGNSGSQLAANPGDAAAVLGGSQAQLEIARGMVEAAAGRLGQ